MCINLLELQIFGKSPTHNLIACKKKELITNIYYTIFFSFVTKKLLAKIDEECHSIGKHTRMSHDMDLDLLIVRLMPFKIHQMAQLLLAKRFSQELGKMGIEDEDGR